MKATRVQVCRLENGGDEIRIYTDTLKPGLAGMPVARSEIDVIVWSTTVPRGTGPKFVEDILASQMELQKYETYFWVGGKYQRQTHLV